MARLSLTIAPVVTTAASPDSPVVDVFADGASIGTITAGGESGIIGVVPAGRWVGFSNENLVGLFTSRSAAISALVHDEQVNQALNLAD